MASVRKRKKQFAPRPKGRYERGSNDIPYILERKSYIRHNKKSDIRIIMFWIHNLLGRRWAWSSLIKAKESGYNFRLRHRV